MPFPVLLSKGPLIRLHRRGVSICGGLLEQGGRRPQPLSRKNHMGDSILALLGTSIASQPIPLGADPCLCNGRKMFVESGELTSYQVASGALADSIRFVGVVAAFGRLLSAIASS